MKTYELVIEVKQPTCGDRAPTRCEIRTVTIEDPVAYVRGLEPGGEPEVRTEDGSLVIRVDRNKGEWAKYTFTED